MSNVKELLIDDLVTKLTGSKPYSELPFKNSAIKRCIRNAVTKVLENYDVTSAPIKEKETAKGSKRGVVDTTKTSNIKCEHCRYCVSAGNLSNKCTNPRSSKHEKEVYYYNRCKNFEWKQKYLSQK